MTRSKTPPTQQFRSNLTRTSSLLFLTAVIIPMVVIWSINIFRTTNYLRDQSILRISKASEIQVELINQIAEGGTALLIQLEQDNRFINTLDRALQTDPESSNWQEDRSAILEIFSRISRSQTRNPFDDIAIVSPAYEIILSSDPALEGIRLAQDSIKELSTSPSSFLYFDNKGEYFGNAGKLVMVGSIQVKDRDGSHVASILGITRSEELARILKIGTYSYPQARSYTIAKSNTGDVFVGLSTTGNEIIVLPVSMDQMNTILPGLASHEEPQAVEYKSFDDTSVYGIINWAHSLDTPILLEVPQSAFPALTMKEMFIQVAFILIMIGVLGLIIWQVTRKILRSIEDISQAAQKFADDDYQARADVNRSDEIGLLAYSFNNAADHFVDRSHSLEITIESQARQIKTAAEVAQVTNASTSLEEMLSITTSLIANRFDAYLTSIYLLDRSGDNLTLRAASGQAPQELIHQGLRIGVGTRSIVGNTAAINKPWVSDDVKQDPYYLEAETLHGTQSEVAIPLSVIGGVIGVLDVQSTELKAFDAEDITSLETSARQISLAIRSLQLRENIQFDLRSVSLLYQTSHRLAGAETTNRVLEILAAIYKQFPVKSQVLSLETGGLTSIDDLSGSGEEFSSNLFIPLSDEDIFFLKSKQFPQVQQTNQPTDELPQGLLDLALGDGCVEFTIITLASRNRLTGIVYLGATNNNALIESKMELYTGIAQTANTSIEKIEAGDQITTNYAELQSLNALSQAISTETNLDNLFKIFHQQVLEIIGDVNFLIALYDTLTDLIQIPYMTEDDQIIAIPNFPLGQGLTSIVIRTKQPLMIVEDTENRARALGAIVTSGRAAKSWLGVPLIVAGEIVGAVAIQDLEKERRFDENDLRLLTTLAGQVAPTIRNARLLADSQESAERDRQLYQTTDKIRRASSIPEILELAATDLSKHLNLQKVKIEINVPSTQTSRNVNDRKEKL